MTDGGREREKEEETVDRIGVGWWLLKGYLL